MSQANVTLTSNTDIYSSGMATKTQRLLDVIMVTSTQRQIITSFDVDL